MLGALCAPSETGWLSAATNAMKPVILKAELKTTRGNEKFEFERLRIDLSFSPTF